MSQWTKERIEVELAVCEAAQRTVSGPSLLRAITADEDTLLAAARTGYPDALRALAAAQAEIERLRRGISLRDALRNYVRSTDCETWRECCFCRSYDGIDCENNCPTVTHPEVRG